MVIMMIMMMMMVVLVIVILKRLTANFGDLDEDRSGSFR
jgi:uncharacterized membrane protein